MNIQNLMKLAAQHAEEQRHAQKYIKDMELLRLIIMITTINDLLNQDTIDKTLQKSATKVLQSFKNDINANDADTEALEAVINLAKVEVKKMLTESAKIMRVKS